MALQGNDTKFSEITEILLSKGLDGMGEMLRVLLNEVMCIEREHHLHAKIYERSPERRGYANGFKEKTLNTRVGPLKLDIPQVRESDFYPGFLEKGLRSERALNLAMAEMYIQGVSTRKVNEILKTLCNFEVSSTHVSRVASLLDNEIEIWKTRPIGEILYLYLDARYEKVREGGHVIDVAVLIAYGVDSEGRRSILGTSVSLSEAEPHWRQFLESLVRRGFHGVKCIISDAHAGLKQAIRAVFPSVPWQRCQFHLQQNAQAYIPKRSMKSEVASTIRGIFNASNVSEAKRLLNMAVDGYRQTAPKLSEWMEKNIEEGLTIFAFPEKHRVRLRTSNMAERVNKEVKRRTRVATLFPSIQSCERLVAAVLMEISENWETGKVYMPKIE